MTNLQIGNATAVSITEHESDAAMVCGASTELIMPLDDRNTAKCCRAAPCQEQSGAVLG